MYCLLLPFAKKIKKALEINLQPNTHAGAQSSSRNTNNTNSPQSLTRRDRRQKGPINVRGSHQGKQLGDSRPPHGGRVSERVRRQRERANPALNHGVRHHHLRVLANGIQARRGGGRVEEWQCAATLH